MSGIADFPPQRPSGPQTLTQHPAILRAFVVFVYVLSGLLGLISLSTEHVEGRDLIRTALLVAFGVGFEEATRRTGRLRFLLSGDTYYEMIGVWVFAGSLVLPGGLAATLVVLVQGYIWVRYYRTSGRELYRYAFTAATIVLAALASHEVMAMWISHSTGSQPLVVLHLFTAMAVFVLVNAGAVNVASYLADPSQSVRDVVGGWTENWTEIATLSLGALAALAVLYEPPMLIFVLPPLVMLQRGALVSQLETAATTDAKTGLLNSAGWSEIAAKELARGQRKGTGVGILMLDLDHFKQVNDHYGHVTGDEVLRAVADCMTDELRDYDSVGRFGGEEFVAVLPDVTATELSDISTRVRLRVRSLTNAQISAGLVASGRDINLSASIGVAHAPQHGFALEELLVAADTALYRAKAKGRNRVEFAGSGADPVSELVTD